MSGNVCDREEVKNGSPRLTCRHPFYTDFTMSFSFVLASQIKTQATVMQRRKTHFSTFPSASHPFCAAQCVHFIDYTSAYCSSLKMVLSAEPYTLSLCRQSPRPWTETTVCVCYISIPWQYNVASLHSTISSCIREFSSRQSYSLGPFSPSSVETLNPSSFTATVSQEMMWRFYTCCTNCSMPMHVAVCASLCQRSRWDGGWMGLCPIITDLWPLY